MIQVLISLAVLAIVFCSAMLGMLVSRILPQNHLTDETKSVVTVSMGVVGTLTALVLGLLIAAASSSFNTKNQEVNSADVIRRDRLLERYGPEAEDLRDLPRRDTAMKIEDLFPEGTTKLPNLENPRTVALSMFPSKIRASQRSSGVCQVIRVASRQLILLKNATSLHGPQITLGLRF